MVKNNGFTLIELLVVMVIIGLLVVISIPAYNSFLSKGRDTKRQSDLKVIQSALEQYHADQGYYPAAIVPGGSLTSSDGTKIYLSNISSDPFSTNATSPVNYLYFSIPDKCTNKTNEPVCTNYCLFAKLENSTGATVPNSCSTLSTYNYAVTPN